MSDIREATALQRALEAALSGGPERHHAKTAEQGKLPVRERVERLVDPESFAEEALLANWDQEGLGARRMAEMVIGEKVTLEEMGGARMHTSVSGCGHFLVSSDEEAIDVARRYLAYMPGSWREPPPSAPPAEPDSERAPAAIVP